MDVRWVSGGKERVRWKRRAEDRERGGGARGKNGDQDERQKKVEDGATMVEEVVVVEEACVPNDVCTPRHVNDISGG